MSRIAANVPPIDRSAGRGYLWAGVGVCLLGIALVVVQISLKYLFVPWYTPALATIGVCLLLLSLARRRTVLRVIALLMVVALAGVEWFVLVSGSKLPDYAGPARAGQQLPAFSTTLADGRPFTDADFRDGSRSVMVFFRGRW